MHGKCDDERVPVFSCRCCNLICDVWCTACSTEWCVIRWATTELAGCIDGQKAQRAELLRVTEEAPLLLYGPAPESSSSEPSTSFWSLPTQAPNYLPTFCQIPTFASLQLDGHWAWPPVRDIVVLIVLSYHQPPWHILYSNICPVLYSKTFSMWRMIFWSFHPFKTNRFLPANLAG